MNWLVETNEKVGSVLRESTARHCAVYQDAKGDWYLELADDEYGEVETADLYGPFKSEQAATDYIDNFSNPGGYSLHKGKRPTPKKAPNGRDIIKPRTRNW